MSQKEDKKRSRTQNIADMLTQDKPKQTRSKSKEKKKKEGETATTSTEPSTEPSDTQLVEMLKNMDETQVSPCKSTPSIQVESPQDTPTPSPQNPPHHLNHKTMT